jgi:hypothetical protein
MQGKIRVCILPKPKKKIPWRLKKLDLVRDEFRFQHFPRTAEEGIRECAELSTSSLAMLKDEIRKNLCTKAQRPVEKETRRLMAHFSHMDGRWKAGRKEARAQSKRP